MGQTIPELSGVTPLASPAPPLYVVVIFATNGPSEVIGPFTVREDAEVIADELATACGHFLYSVHALMGIDEIGIDINEKLNE